MRFLSWLKKSNFLVICRIYAITVESFNFYHIPEMSPNGAICIISTPSWQSLAPGKLSPSIRLLSSPLETTTQCFNHANVFKLENTFCGLQNFRIYTITNPSPYCLLTFSTTQHISITNNSLKEFQQK